MILKDGSFLKTLLIPRRVEDGTNLDPFRLANLSKTNGKLAGKGLLTVKGIVARFIRLFNQNERVVMHPKRLTFPRVSPVGKE